MPRLFSFLFGSRANDTLFGGSGRDRIFGLSGDDTIEAGRGRDLVIAGSGDDVVDAGGGDDRVFAGRGDDTVEGGAGSDRMFGGRGIDTAAYAGSVEDFAIETQPGRRATVTSLDGSGDVDRLQSFERLYFREDDYTVDLTGGNNAVLARDDAADAGAQGETVLADLTGNDFDFDGHALAITAIDTTGLIGTATLVDGVVTYDADGAFDALAEGETGQTTFSYTVTDGNGSTDTATVTLTVTGTNDAPVLTAAATADVAENTTEVLTATASDVDNGDTVTFSLTGADAARFAIGPDGALRFVDAPDFEAPADADGDNGYDVTIVATDAAGATDTQDVTITVTDEAEAPALRINELHYDNAGADVGEFVELAGAPSFDLTGWQLVFYNGTDSQRAPYATFDLTGTTNAQGFVSFDGPANGIQNGAPDGLALVAPDGTVTEFLSYEGTFTAASGPAEGLTSTDIGVAEGSSTEIGTSLQLQEDGTWAPSAPQTRDAVNDGSGGGGPTVTDTLSLNEFHYDNDGGDVGEFIEVAGPAGEGLTGWSIVVYNGSNGTVERSIDLTGALSGSDGTGYASVDVPGLQNGNEAIALVSPAGEVAEFIAYEGDLTAVGGPADGMTALDIGVAEGGGTQIGQSLQKDADGTWFGPATATRDAPNDGGGGGGGEPEAVLISQVQGAGDASPLAGDLVSVTAVVTAVLAIGFFLQEEDADTDGDAATSEGIFVLSADTVTVGDVVVAEGIVEEQFGFTRIDASVIDVTGTADLPTAAGLTLPFTMETDLEAVEGMQVVLTSADDADPLTVIENFNFDRFAELTVSAGEQIQPTQIFDAQDDAAEVDALQQQNALNRIIIDDGSTQGNPGSFAYIANDTAGDNGDGILSAGDDIAAGNVAPRLGAQITEPVEGVLDFSFGEYRIVPSGTLAIDPATNDGAREPDAPEVGGELTVVSFNALNYFTTLGERGAETAGDLARQTEKLVNALVELDADIVGLQEIENNGSGDGSAIATLVEALNARLGGEVYGLVDPTEDGGLIGTDAITTGLIYKTGEVSVLGSDFLEFSDGDRQQNRPAVAAAFEDADGGVVTIAVNHFKSKGGTGTGDDADSGDGQGNFNQTRTDAAIELTEWLAGDPFATGDPDYLIIGDLNAYSQEDPVQAIEAAGYTNLLEEFVGAADAFSFVFDGQRGALDHAMASDTLSGQVTGVAEWHINSPEPDLLNYSTEFNDASFYDGTTPYGASDHDPLLIGLTLTGPDDGTVLA